MFPPVAYIYLLFHAHSMSRPDMTFAVDWALETNYLSIYLSTLGDTGVLHRPATEPICIQAYLFERSYFPLFVVSIPRTPVLVFLCVFLFSLQWSVFLASIYIQLVRIYATHRCVFLHSRCRNECYSIYTFFFFFCIPHYTFERYSTPHLLGGGCIFAFIFGVFFCFKLFWFDLVLFCYIYTFLG